MHKTGHRKKVENGEEGKLMKQPAVFMVYHVIWILNCIEILYLIHNLCTSYKDSRFYFFLFILFNIACMVASILYADYYERGYGRSLWTKAILVLFVITSVFCCLIVYFLELSDLVRFNQLQSDEVQQSLENMLLFTVPVLHCVMLGYIAVLRSRPAVKRPDSYSEAQRKLNPRNTYSRQRDEPETQV
ncbi:unnamed protein product [Moneuplotes crassus]|uniref:Uncharacterized protein n=1 Tax=Euplotes crassus TaxID=5936 RepID=A0AAD2D424_EUPCR|nr:unnamed protein product [Moneuplotes crassus]